LDEIFGKGDHASLLAVDDVAVNEGQKTVSLEAEKPDSSLMAVVMPSVGSDLDVPSAAVESDPAGDIEILSAPSDEIKADLLDEHDGLTGSVHQDASNVGET
jgi:hypothetical protein